MATDPMQETANSLARMGKTPLTMARSRFITSGKSGV
jgi:hypothetical protein